MRILAAGAWDPLPRDRAELGLALGRVGEAAFRDLLQLWRALEAAPEEQLAGMEQELELLLRAGFCFSPAELAVQSADLKGLGFSGAELGSVIRSLLEEVQSGRLPNEQAALLSAAEKRKKAAGS